MPIGVRSCRRKFRYRLKETAPPIPIVNWQHNSDSHSAPLKAGLRFAEVVNHSVNGTEVPTLLVDTWCAYYSLELGDSIAVYVNLLSALQDSPELISDGSLAPSASLAQRASTNRHQNVANVDNKTTVGRAVSIRTAV